MNIERKIIDLKSLTALPDGNGGFEGYANNFGSLDAYDDITLPGCFAECLSHFMDCGWSAPDHSWGVKNEIGIIAEAKEDKTGLFVSVEFHPTADAQMMRQKIAHRLEKGKSVKLSIGYSTLESEIVSGASALSLLKNPDVKTIDYLKQTGTYVRLLKKVKLYEVSPVSIGAEPTAAITAVKHAPVLSLNDAAKSNYLEILKLKLRVASAL